MKKINLLELLSTGVKPVLFYNFLVDLDVNQRMSISFKGGDITLKTDGSNYTRQVFKEALSRARLLSN